MVGGLYQEPLKAPLFFMGCFSVDFQEVKRPIRAKSGKRPINRRLSNAALANAALANAALANAALVLSSKNWKKYSRSGEASKN